MTASGLPNQGLALAHRSPAHNRMAALAALIAEQDRKGYVKAKKAANVKARAQQAAQQERLS